MCVCGACKGGSEKKNRKKTSEVAIGSKEDTAMEVEISPNAKIPDYHSQ